MNDIKILSFEESFDASYGDTLVQFQQGNAISFAFSSVDIRDAVKDPNLLLADLQANTDIAAKRPLWSDLSENLQKAILCEPFDMCFIEHDDPDWTADMADALWDEVSRLDLYNVVTCGENDALITVFAGAIGSINWDGHPEYGVPCFEHEPEETKMVQPFRIAIKETYVREVEIYALDSLEAEQIAEDLCSEGVIDLNYEYFTERSTSCRGIARPIDLDLHEVYDKNGKVTPVRSQPSAHTTPDRSQVASSTYFARFIPGKTVEQLNAELNKMHEDLYSHGRSIDRTRLWDIQYTLKVLSQQKGLETPAAPAKPPLVDKIQSAAGRTSPEKDSGKDPSRDR